VSFTEIPKQEHLAPKIILCALNCIQKQAEWGAMRRKNADNARRGGWMREDERG
jgi:hypothetical protein